MFLTILGKLRVKWLKIIFLEILKILNDIHELFTKFIGNISEDVHFSYGSRLQPY